jgi:hypothetical protein
LSYRKQQYRHRTFWRMPPKLVVGWHHSRLLFIASAEPDRLCD